MSQATLRCQVIPDAHREVHLQADGETRCTWHAGTWAPRPCLFPLIGPSGHTVTRMGHPGAPNHDHHQSVWFAHAKVLGINFWSNTSPAQIRQKSWLVYEDGDEHARIAVRLGWYDGHDPAELIEQDVFITLLPLENRELLLDIQTTLRPAAEELELGQSNFGLLAVRVAKNISAHFGGGRLLSSENRSGEPEIFGQAARWVDYSGPAPPNEHDVPREGIAYLDHRDNPSFPSHWHVREDGWMCASLCMNSSLVLRRASPLHLRYGLYVHGDATRESIERQVETLHEQPRLGIQKGTRRHEQFEFTFE